MLAKPLPDLDEMSQQILESSEPIIANIDLEQAKAFFDEGIPFIDARHNEYYAEGRISGSLPSEDFMELLFVLDTLAVGKDNPVVTYCDGDDCGSSEDLAYDLQSSGYNLIYIFVGGWSAWLQAGYPMEK